MRTHFREVRVRRVVSAFAAGSIVNPLTAYSQFIWAARIWGLSSALHEATEIDAAEARYVNDNLADYLIPVNADVPDLEVIIVPEEDDKVNPPRREGHRPEIGIVGMNLRRWRRRGLSRHRQAWVRDLPIRIEALL